MKRAIYADDVTPAGAPTLEPQRWLALGVIVTATLMVVLDASVINIALPQAQRDLGIIDVNRHWAITAYAVAFGGLLLLGGRVADYAGRKRTMIVGLLGFAVASMMGGVAQSQWTLFAARALQGLFAAALAPAALALVSVSFTEPHERAKAFGIYGAVSGAGGAIGLIVGGVLTDYASWRWCMFVNVPIALIAAMAATKTVRESRVNGPRRYDVAGALLASAGTAALVIAFTVAGFPGSGWTSPATLLTLAAAVILLMTFVIAQSNGRHPLLPLRIILDRNRGGTFLIAALIGAGMFGALLFLTFYLQTSLGYTPLHAGLAFLPFSGAIIVTSMLSASLLPRTGPKHLMISGTLIATSGMLLLTTLHPASTFLLPALPGETLVAIGVGLVFVPINSAALSGIDPDDTGIASALVNAAIQLGGALGVALLNTLYAGAVTARGLTATTHATAVFAGYRTAFIAASGLFIVATIIALFMLTPTKEAT